VISWSRACWVLSVGLSLQYGNYRKPKPVNSSSWKRKREQGEK